MIGVIYGTQHQIGGVKVHDFTSWKFLIPSTLVTDVDWRIPRNGNSYFNLEFAKDDVARISQFDLGAATGYKRIRANKSNNIDQLHAGPAYLGWATISLQYAYQQQRVRNEGTRTEHGIRMQVYKEFASLFDVTTYAAYWFKSWQYSVSVKYNPFGSAFYVAAGFEKIETWKEISISVLYGY